MSQGNVEIARRLWEASQRSLEVYWENPSSASAALEAGDLNTENEAVLACLHREVEFNPVAVAVEGGAVRGHLGWLKFWGDFLSATDELGFSIEELEDLGGETVFAAAEFTVTWKDTGLKLSEPRFLVVTIRDGLVARVNSYRDRAEALEAAGLLE